MEYSVWAETGNPWDWYACPRSSCWCWCRSSAETLYFSQNSSSGISGSGICTRTTLCFRASNARRWCRMAFIATRGRTMRLR
ncbi:hypothetical protein DF049_13300 [Burkholderia cenocepacia]|nr:hypothetical protein DF049_13300 [Burkholderia cenocepacia]RQU97649.1 hypothetical protein DF042_27940 [Burkholderia cenocepacia]